MNTIKYTAGTETLSLKKDNFYFGVGDSDKGPTEISGYYAGITPPTSGYTVYLARTGTSEPSIYSVSNDNDLINLTNIIAATAFTNTEQCLTYYRNQTDKVCVNIDYEPIVTDGLVLNFDAGFTPSYPRTGTTWYSVGSSGNTGTLRNGITFSANTFSFDGADDHVKIPFTTFPIQGPGTIVFTGSYSSLSPYRNAITLGNGTGGSNGSAIQVGVIYGVGYVWRAGGGTLLTYTTPQTGVTYQWAITFSGSNISVYINGVLDAQTNEALFQSGSSNNFWIGTFRDSGAEAFAGSIYNCYLYNKVLSNNEILQNYNALRDRFFPPSPSPTPTSTPIPTPTPSPTGGIVTDSLFMKLDASNYTSGLWEDETGNGNDATINGATWSSTDGGIFDLDGSNDNISIPHTSNLSLNTTTQRTIQVWVKFDALGSTSTQQIPVFGKLSSNFSFDGYWGGLYGNTGTIRVVTNGGSTQRITTSTLTVTTNTWYLFTFISQITSTPNTTKVYINETEYATTAHGSDSYSESNPLYLGYIGSGVSSPYLNGKIGACYFYTKGLSTSDISDNFNATKSKYGL
jgi:hypothetical protein